MLLPPAARHREFDRRNMDTVVVSVVAVSRGASRRTVRDAGLRVKYQIQKNN